MKTHDPENDKQITDLKSALAMSKINLKFLSDHRFRCT